MKTSHILVIATLVIATQFSAQALAAKGGNKPPPEPPPPVVAEDVVCDGCVGTTDIEDGAVTEQKLSAGINDLLGTISELEARLDALEAKQSTPVAKVFAGDVYLGDLIASVDFGTTFALFEPISGFFLGLSVSTGSGVSTVKLKGRLIMHESFDCTGQGFAVGVAEYLADTRNVLVGNGDDFYRSIGTYTGIRPLTLNSGRDPITGLCSEMSYADDNANLALVEQVSYPLPYALPITAPAFGLRLEYVAP